MAEHLDPWTSALSGPWTEKIERGQKPCRYCGKPAAMNEPGKPGKAHKVCAEGNLSTGPLGSWDDADRKLVKDVPLGCGAPATTDQASGRVCAGRGTQLSCQLCPNSPTYHRVT